MEQFPTERHPQDHQVAGLHCRYEKGKPPANPPAQPHIALPALVLVLVLVIMLVLALWKREGVFAIPLLVIRD